MVAVNISKMVKGIVNLTRKVLPVLSSERLVNIKSMNEMPESILASLIRNGDKSIVQVGMNQCAATRITQNGITTIFTEGLAGCNSVGLVTKGLDGNPIAMLSHYTPLSTSRANQVEVLRKQLDMYQYYFDKSSKPKIFYNLRDNEPNNPILSQCREMLNKRLGNYDEIIMPYQNTQRPHFFSTANIFQFNPSNLNELKVTGVGEVEKNINLLL